MRDQTKSCTLTVNVAVLLGLVAAGNGCGRVVFQPAGQTAAAPLSPQEQQVLSQQAQEWQRRAAQLDKDNQDLESRLAQSLQQLNLLKEEVVATRDQLRSTTQQLKGSLAENETLKKRTDALAASVQRRTGAEIRPNNSLLKDLAVKHLPGVQVRQDVDLIRIELPSDQLFQGGTTTLRPAGAELIRAAAADVARHYPGHIVGIEGHADGGSVSPSLAGGQIPLTISQAAVVYDLIVREGRLSPPQLFVVGHGGNHPVVSNATEQGRARNRRVELVVYPETAGR
jgi:flagellar motor protein MotB